MSHAVTGMNPWAAFLNFAEAASDDTMDLAIGYDAALEKIMDWLTNSHLNGTVSVVLVSNRGLNFGSFAASQVQPAPRPCLHMLMGAVALLPCVFLCFTSLCRPPPPPLDTYDICASSFFV